MAHKPSNLTVNGVTVEVVRKRVKFLRLTIYPPDGRVSASVPLNVATDDVKRMVIRKMNWINRHREKLKRRPQPSLAATGETHTLFGKSYHLHVVNGNATPQISLTGVDQMELVVPLGTDTAGRKKILREWYRARLSERIPAIVKKWEPVLGVQAKEWRVRAMKTKWGSCNIKARRIWLNLALAKYPPEYLDCIAVHELTHLLERLHNKRFKGFMDAFLPGWQTLERGLRHYSTDI